MKTTIYHNPKCSKSRQALDYLTKNVAEFEVIEYLKTPPTLEEILTICQKLNLPAKSLIRDTEKQFHDLNLSLNAELTDHQWADIIANNPTLLQRPIVVTPSKGAIGRPLENIMALFDRSDKTHG